MKPKPNEDAAGPNQDAAGAARASPPGTPVRCCMRAHPSASVRAKGTDFDCVCFI